MKPLKSALIVVMTVFALLASVSSSTAEEPDPNPWGGGNSGLRGAPSNADEPNPADAAEDLVSDLTAAAEQGVLAPITGSGKSATATFTPAVRGQKTSLQLRTIETTETNETPTPRWETIATSTQSSTGQTTFSISDPREVSHEYRAVSGGVVSNTVTFAAPLPSKATGLSQVYFNSYEGDSVNTRTRYFEGEFSMTPGAGCGAVTTTPKTEMKGRGNYSWTFAKKSFTLKLKDGLNLCGMGKSKKWAFVANHYDKSLMRNVVAGNVGKALTELAWTPKSKPIDFYVNGSYRGSYILIERITVDDERVDIPELKGPGDDGEDNRQPNVSGGYILEWDFRRGADVNIHAGDRGSVGIKEPEDPGDPEGITSAQSSYINSYVDKTDSVLFGGNFQSNSDGWRKYIDINSAVDYYIGMELMKPVDGNMWASVYMYKQRNGKLFFGPLWDFDLAMGSANRAGNVVSPRSWYLRNSLGVSAMQSSKTWFNRLNEDPDFRSAVRARWNEVYPQLSQSSFIDEYKLLIQESANENFKKWSVKEHLSKYQVVKGSFSAEVEYLKSWMKSRRGWMNGQL
ncbi:CotH kinase family protein [Aeromicrobium sp.]|uniref:CotH kinase family protein n=1 Tax=Aeromicrobium sp. TaxID=1871063 RepID=UPI003D6C0588